MSGAGGIGSGISDFGSAVGDLFSAAGARDAASMYGQAAAAAQANVQIEQGSLITQTAQATRQYQLVAGTQATQISAAGFAAGSATGQALASASKSQFGVSLQTLTNNNIIQQDAYKEQVDADKSMQAQEELKATAADVGAGFSAVAGVASIAGAFV
jgi:hypothetical protein